VVLCREYRIAVLSPPHTSKPHELLTTSLPPTRLPPPHPPHPHPVTLITVFVEDNQGDEEATRVTKIALAGWAGEVFNVAEIKKQEEGA